MSTLPFRTFARTAAFAAAAVTGLATAGCGAQSSHVAVRPSFAAGSADLGSLHVSGAYVPDRASPSVTAAYFTVSNSGPADTLMSVSSAVSTDVGLHQAVEHGSAGEMVPVDSLPVPSGGLLRLQPGGYHVMLMQPSRLSVGQLVDLTLHFAHAGALRLRTPVVPLTATNDDTSSMPMSGSK